ncbi:hypothetical protein IBL26_08270 [Roseomonas aerophila]|uniref:Uncharacterized protein n=1 Tax=Teichococcus aerophilus TaxID=1224513 RepID=A0ABR7RKI8_9PROT|nr:hypothetical protein [Pseudoroseomonas aerophila]MBC9206829.1 hypothetical protein [Pseudoroseomonas aerophila]
MCDVATGAVVVGGAIAGAAAGSGSKKSSATSTSSPWGPQATHLDNAFNGASAQYDAQLGRPAWEATNPTAAGFNATQQEGAALAADYGRGAGGALSTGVANQAGALMGAGTNYLQNAGALAQNGAGQANGMASGVLSQAATGQPMGSSGVAGSSGLAGQQGALSTATALAAQGQTNLNPSIQQAAAGYVNSDLVNGQVDAATRDVARTLGEETLPGLNARAMAGGNINSARAGAAEAVARRGAEDRAADISSGIRNNAYNTGVNAALTANAQQNNLALTANAQSAAAAGALSNLGENQRQFDTSTRVGAAQSLGALDTSNRSLDSQTRLAANSQLGDATSLGFQGAQLAGALTDANAGRIGAQGDLQQAEAQRLIDQNRTQYYAQEQSNQAALQNYYGIVGAGNWGNSTTQTTATPGPGVLGGALGGAAGAYGLYNSFGASAAGGAGGSTSGGALSLGKLFSGTADGGSKGALYRGA